jgi:hypothetical protein
VIDDAPALGPNFLEPDFVPSGHGIVTIRSEDDRFRASRRGNKVFTEQELFTRLHANEMDQSELESIMTSHFHGASAASSNEVVFPGTSDPTKVALMFRFKKGRLTAISGGPALKEEDITALQSVIESELAPAPLRVWTEVLFAIMPVTGVFRYQDVFQVLPVPSDAPRPRMLSADHPFLLQFKYKLSQTTFVGAARRQAHARKLQLLLSVLLEGGTQSLKQSGKFHWVIPPIDPEKPRLPRSMYCQEMYMFESFDKLAVDSFCDITNIEPLPLIDPVAY